MVKCSAQSIYRMGRAQRGLTPPSVDGSLTGLSPSLLQLPSPLGAACQSWKEGELRK